MKTFALDANAILGYIQSGSGSAKVEQLLVDAFRQHQPLLISVLNWGEIFYVVWQRAGEEKARKIMADLSRVPIEVIPVDLSQALKAGEIKALHKIPYVDCIAASLALERQATLVTSDRDFEKLGRHFPILWLPRH